MTAAQTWLVPATATVHLQFNAGEDVDVELTVVDRHGQPVPIKSARAVVGLPGCDTALHQWTEEGGGLVVLPQATQPGALVLHSTAAQTAAWYREWADAEWQLDAVDVFDRSKRACEGDVRVNPSRQGAP